MSGRWSRVWIAAVAGFLIGADVVLGAESRPTGRGTAGLVPVTVQLNWRHQFEFAAFYAAQVRGFYREAGISVRLLEGGPDVDAVGAVLAGRADFGVGNSGLMIMRSEGKPVVVLGAIMQHSAISLLASREKGIDNVLDLDGKTVHCPPHAREEINAYLKASGLDLSRVTYAPASSTVGPERLEHVDATEVYTTNDGFRILGQEHRYVLFVPRSAGIDLYGDVLFTLEKTLTTRRDLCDRFRDATFRGLREAMDHPDEFIDLILATCNSQGKSREHLAFEAERLRQMIRPELVEPGYMSHARWRHVRDVFASVGRLPADYDFAGFLDVPDRRTLPRWVAGAIAMLAVGMIVTALVVVKVQAMNRSLQGEVARRIRSEREIRDAEQRFRQFVGTASSVVTHDVHTPLTVMRLQVETLRRKYPQWADAGGPHLEALSAAIARIEELVSRNLALLLESDGHSDRRTTDVSAVMEDAIGSFERMWEAHRIRRRVMQAGVACDVAPGMVRTILFNLLDNAAKYGDPGVPIRVGLEKVAEAIQISVGNRCLVPPPSAPETLFGKGERGNAAEDVPGSGHGLHLVRLLAETHGGTATIAVEGDWLEAVVTLPVAGHAT